VLRRMREQAGLTQRQLADRLGVQQPAVARWEAGGVQIPINRIERIVAEFGYGIEYDLRAVPINQALNDGVPFQLMKRRTNMDPRPVGLPESAVRSGPYLFAVNRDQPWIVDMWLAETGQHLAGAVAVIYERIRELVPHPDGVLVRMGQMTGKITSSAKCHGDDSPVFAYTPADERDLDFAGQQADALRQVL
jgi:transcriptional regulator with XRE-family HTH domain